MKQIFIIGGGISGLSAAYRLSQLSSDVAITLCERDVRWGGKIQTDMLDVEGAGRFVIEGAPDSFLARKPAGIALCEELGIATRLIGRDPRHARTFVKRNHRLHPLPEGLSGLIPTRLEALEKSELLSLEGRVRFVTELDLPAAVPAGDESLADFITRRFGAEAYEAMIEPLMSGIYGGDGRTLSLLATFPQLRSVEQQHGSVIRGLQATNPSPSQDTNAPRPSYPPFISFTNGMGELVDALLARLRAANNVSLRLGEAVEAIESSKSGPPYTLKFANGEGCQADAIILATPAFVTARLLSTVAPRLAKLHTTILYGSSATISLLYQNTHLPTPLNGYGYLIPRVEGTDVLACTWSSNKWNGRAPEGWSIARVYLGRDGLRDVTQLSDEELLDLALAEVRQVVFGGMRVPPPPHTWRIYRWPQSMPQYHVGHVERVQQIEQEAATLPGIFLAGSAYRGVGIPDCIRSGEEAARGVIELS